MFDKRKKEQLEILAKQQYHVMAYRNVLLSDNEDSEYVFRDILYRILGFGKIIETEYDKACANVAQEILTSMGLTNESQADEFIKALRSIPEPPRPEGL